jgi:hypothetical protein
VDRFTLTISPCLLEFLTTPSSVGILFNVEATLLVRDRIVYSESAFAELVLWRLLTPVNGGTHRFKYRLAYVVKGLCVVRYDNESRKGDHRHFGNKESSYVFVNPEQLMADFQKDIARWNRENRDS